MSIYMPWKALHHRNRINDLSNGKRIFPTELKLGLTTLCNQNCNFCYNVDTNKNHASLDFERINTLLEEVSKHGVKGIHLTGGGEPSVHPEFYHIVDKIFEEGLELGLVTNGYNLDFKKLEKATWIRMSIDAFYEDTYKKIHGVDKRSDDYFREFCSNKDVVKGASFIITPDNYLEILDTAIWAKKIGFDNIRISPIHADNSASLLKDIWDKCEEQIAKAKELNTDTFRVFAQIDRYDILKNNTLSFRECYWQQFSAYIWANGDLYPCCETQGNTRLKLGNIYEKSFEEIWLERELQKPEECGVPCLFSRKNEFIEYLVDSSPIHVNFV